MPAGDRMATCCPGWGAPSRPPRGGPVHGFQDFRPDIRSAFTLNAPPQKYPLVIKNLFQMEKQIENSVPKASEQYELPSSKVTAEGGATLSGVGVIAPALKVGLTPATGSLVTLGPGAGVYERDTSAGGLFGPEDPVKVKNRKKKKGKGSKGGTGGGVLVTKGAGPPAPSKRNHSDGFPREN